MRPAARALAGLAMLGSLACAPPSRSSGVLRDVPFERLAEGESFTVGAATLMVARSAGQAAALARLASATDARERLTKVDFRRSSVIGIFVGPMGSSGHRISVQTVEADAVAVRITVAPTRPAPGHNANDVLSYPYAIIAVPAPLAPARGAWTVVGPTGEVFIDRSLTAR